MFGKLNAVSDNKFGWSCWSVKKKNPKKELTELLTLAYRFNSIQDRLPHSGDNTTQWMCYHEWGNFKLHRM